jgi:hypothetical protein
MEKVLLAIDGTNPDKKVFGYALQLCQRIKAELDVIWVMKPSKYKKYLKKAGQITGHASKYIEGSLVAATYAEASDHETAEAVMSEALKHLKQLLPEPDKAGVQYRLTMKAGNPKDEIVNYINGHREVILAIYDAPGEKRDHTMMANRHRSVLSELKQALSIPLVVIQPESS